MLSETAAAAKKHGPVAEAATENLPRNFAGGGREMSHITEIMFSVPDGTEANCASVEAVQSYCKKGGDTAGWLHMKFAGGNVLSNDLYIFTLRHCYLGDFLLFVNSLPWHEDNEARIEMFIKDEDWAVFKRFGPSIGWLLPYDPHVDEDGIAREFEGWPEEWPGVQSLQQGFVLGKRDA